MDRPWAGYVRVSHVGGREGDAFRSPRDQAADIEAWAARRGEPVVLLAPELDESGGRADRPILAGAIEGIERGEYRGLVVAYLSRASRSVRHLLEMWDRIEQAGGQVVAVAENIDTSTPSGRLTRTMLAAIAEHELDLHRERFETLRANSVAAGIWQRRQTPAGYTRDPATRRLVPDDRAPLVVAAFQQRARGMPLSVIARDLGMTVTGARRLLANEVYLGKLQVGRHVNETAHPALVDHELFLAANHAVSSRPARSTRWGGPALLAGLVRCCGCGHVMTRSATHGVLSYSCHRNHSAGRCPAPTSITARLLDEHVTAIALWELAQVSVAPAADSSAAEQARGELAVARGELAAYLDAVSAQDVGAEAFGRGARARRDRVLAAEGALGSHVGAALPGRTDLPALWESEGVHGRNRLLRGLVEAVLVERAGRRGRWVAIEPRVRVIRFGAGVVEPYRGGGSAQPIRRIALPDRGDPVVLGVPLAE